MDDNILAQTYTDAMTSGDEDRIAAIERELDRRDQADDGFVSDEDAHAFLDNLAGKKPPTEREQAKEAYQLWVHAQYLRASEATNGRLLSRKGMASGYDETALFDGRTQRSQLASLASEELLRWFADSDERRMTETDFINQWLGKQSRKDRDRLGSRLSEF